MNDPMPIKITLTTKGVGGQGAIEHGPAGTPETPSIFETARNLVGEEGRIPPVLIDPIGDLEQPVEMRLLTEAALYYIGPNNLTEGVPREGAREVRPIETVEDERRLGADRRGGR